MNTPYELVREFHEAFDLPISDVPGFPDQKCRDLRRDLLAEEYNEFIDAEIDGDFIEVADALGDMIYIIAGTALAYGIDLDVVFAEIHRSNMDKLFPDGSVLRRGDGKVLKPPAWTAPDIATALGVKS